jgi:hypothetical protein
MGAGLDPRGSALSWCRRERIGGDGALAAGPRAARTVALTRAQELTLISTIRAGFPGADELWTRRSVGALATSLLGVALRPARVSRLLSTWGVVAREPTERACPMCAGLVARWMSVAYPIIALAAAAHRADLHWIGRVRLCGATPSADVVTAVSGQPGRLRLSFMIAPSAGVLPREFLDRLCAGGRAAHAIVDGSWATWQLPRRPPDRVVVHPMPSCERSF